MTEFQKFQKGKEIYPVGGGLIRKEKEGGGGKNRFVILTGLYSYHFLTFCGCVSVCRVNP